MKPLGGGVSMGDTTCNNTINHFHGGRKTPFDTYLTEMSGHSDGYLLTNY
jgi:hypothetical protein